MGDSRKLNNNSDLAMNSNRAVQTQGSIRSSSNESSGKEYHIIKLVEKNKASFAKLDRRRDQ